MAKLPPELLRELMDAVEQSRANDLPSMIEAVMARNNDLLCSYLLQLSARFLVTARQEEDDARRTAAFLGNSVLSDATKTIRAGAYLDGDHRERRQAIEDCIQDFYESD